MEDESRCRKRKKEGKNVDRQSNKRQKTTGNEKHITKKRKKTIKAINKTENNPEEEKKNKNVVKERQILLPGQHGIFKDSECILQVPSAPYRQISIDPGRKDIVTIFEPSFKENERTSKPYSKSEFRNFSSGEFHQMRKTKVLKKRLEKDLKSFIKQKKENAEAIVGSTEDCFKTTFAKDFKSTWEHRLHYENKLWEFYGLKMHRKRKFLSYQAKQRTERQICLRILNVNSDVNRKLKEGLPTVIAYGDAKFPTNVKGNNSTPVSSIAKKLSHFPNVTVILANEFRTSQRCFTCYSKLTKNSSLTH